MPKKKKKSKKGKGKKGKKGKAKEAGPINHHGKAPGGLPLTVHTTKGTIEIAENRYCRVLDAKTRITEVTQQGIETLHLFVPSPEGRQLHELKGYSAAWGWPGEQLVLPMDDELPLSTYGLEPNSTLFVLVKIHALSRHQSFVDVPAGAQPQVAGPGPGAGADKAGGPAPSRCPSARSRIPIENTKFLF